MSILIKEMAMPKNCAECEISQAYDIRSTWCPLTFTTQAELKRQDNCPLIELPPHGDLIDRDALMSGVDDGDDVMFIWAITDAPTIIESEE